MIYNFKNVNFKINRNYKLHLILLTKFKIQNSKFKNSKIQKFKKKKKKKKRFFKLYIIYIKIYKVYYLL